MALFQAAEHLLHHRLRVRVAGSFFDARPVFVMNGLPVETSGLGLPVFVAHRGPDFFERIEIKLPVELAGRLSEARQGSREQQKQTRHFASETDWGKRTGSDRSRSFWAMVIALAPSRFARTTTPV